jgi:hypothetical protein
MVVERVLCVGCAALALSACDYKYVHSRTSAASETRAVGSFDAIEFEGDARLEITVGEPAEVIVHGSRSVIGRTETRVDGNTLHIEVQRKDWSWGKDRQRLTLQIKVPQLRLLELDGGNDVRLSGFKGGQSSITVHGAARIRARGELDQLTVLLAGAGHADLSRLVVNNAKVTVDGVGSVFVHSKQTLDATMNGVGAIFYSGTPSQVNSSMNGLGTISRRDGHDESRHHRHRDADEPRDDEGGDDGDSDADNRDDEGGDADVKVNISETL